ncbi:ROK family protein, partial [Cutibacterium acnes]
IDIFVRDLAAGLVSVRNAVDPKVIVLGGGLIDAKDVWWNRLEQAIREATPKEVPILAAKLGNRAGMVGAAKLAMDRRQL